MTTASLEDYFRTTFQDKLLVKMPEREEDHLTAATRLLEKRREMNEVEQALNAQKGEFQMKMESLQQRREELERKEYQLKSSLLKFDKFLKENDSKRTRALKKATSEQEQGRMKAREIEMLTGKVAQLTASLDKQRQRLEKLSVYHRYLDRILETAEEFTEIRDITARHDTLVTTHKDLMETDHSNQDAVEAQRTHLLKLTEEKNNEILNYNNKLAHLQTELEDAKSRAVKWESQWAHIQNTAAEKTLLLGRINMATHNLYMLVNKYLGKKVEKGDTGVSTVQQLDKIQVCIQDLTEITQDVQRAGTTSTAVYTASPTMHYVMHN
ncbi:coiled-coil domain-containing protein 42 homolog [Corticium candelabrum]|uniref:coiled-coil domain-containing protein 42 homolog n=1 Tax=Corticium candelabrum TaxID=121492 RepID=UPI002E259A9C|nr:coiled-coil domain-containing protein 42 homolog [Corticium candelabrum]